MLDLDFRYARVFFFLPLVLILWYGVINNPFVTAIISGTLVIVLLGIVFHILVLKRKVERRALHAANVLLAWIRITQVATLNDGLLDLVWGQIVATTTPDQFQGSMRNNLVWLFNADPKTANDVLELLIQDGKLSPKWQELHAWLKRNHGS